MQSYRIEFFKERMMHFPQWVDLKGQDAIPDTVHHVVCKVDAKRDKMWIRIDKNDRVQVILLMQFTAVSIESFTIF